MLRVINSKLDKIIKRDAEYNKVLGVPEIAEILNVSKSTLYQRWKVYRDQGYPIQKGGLSNKIQAVKGDLIQFVKLNSRRRTS